MSKKKHLKPSNSILEQTISKDIVLTTKQLDGEEVIPLKFVKFQNVQVPFFYNNSIHNPFFNNTIK